MWFLLLNQMVSHAISKSSFGYSNPTEILWKIEKLFGKHKVFFVWMLKGGLGQLTTLFVVLLLQQQE
ncbi:MAG: hypothetical protein CMO44_14555 [Verrucomicrobiales bacterium]|nr:hypothetical protein [Verrucomicrobiales bacterium]